MSQIATAELVEEKQEQPSLSFKRNIQYLRGLAAVAVMLSHSGYYYDKFFNDEAFRPYFPDMFGLYGVAIFFAISGYLMAELIVKQDAFEFITRRVLRIYPTFLLATLIGLMVIPDLMPLYQPISSSLAPAGDVLYPLAIEWTLVNEIFFYVALFGIAIACGTKWIVPLAIFWIVSITLNSAMSTEFTRIGKATLSEMPLMLANAGFAAGLLVPSMARRLCRPALMIAIFGVSVVVAHLVPANFVRITCGIGAGFLVLAAVQARLPVPHIAHRLLDALGDWSYSLYLIHVTIITLCFTQFGSLGLGYAILPLTIAVTIAAAAALGTADTAMHQSARHASTMMSRLVLMAFASGFVAIWLAISLWIELGHLATF